MMLDNNVEGSIVSKRIIDHWDQFEDRVVLFNNFINLSSDCV